ncbi:hypothetical protein DMENIID0001_040250 [Sergentomyia squamirostris]
MESTTALLYLVTAHGVGVASHPFLEWYPSGWYTGKVLDFVVKSKYCKACEYWSKKEKTAEYNEWKETHEDSCEANHEGSAGKMEVDSATEMFARSVDKNEVIYLNYVGDGDAKTYKSIVEENPEVKKKECVDHVQKRMGTRLRNLVKKTKATTPFVPEGKSWCKWQQLKAIGKEETHKHQTELKEEVLQAIIPVYEDLSNDDLLTRCLGSYTQNSNESFNSTIWSIAPKSFSSGKKILDISVNLATLYYNDGYSGIMDVMQKLDILIGPNCYNFCHKADSTRIQLSLKSLSEKAKETRRSKLSARKGEEQHNLNMEGQLYGAGIAD